ncbi:UDP-N-acetylmuramoyl-L-alanyl-D-glutamate--2,6-diaminopimelate ligase [Halobacillus campisalis]|uniref:UDP-N-acetylmuramyl-tripeptide synthetase n=1 Tax=Halobacillus campisalis TaxID=435909 RepID=A0ABW2K665_9BACI|nr:UDP-N-acetylmuramoyl-L-alanyl-D-glutamate--2,6-diaminopimelate ligase [Halobacillus campisalis]
MQKKLQHWNEVVEGTVLGPLAQYASTVEYDSRETTEDSIFVCIPGENYDGHQFIEQAIKNGAKTVAGTDAHLLSTYSSTFPSITFIHVADARIALSHLSSHVFGNPSESLSTIGVTGTNGKTTVTSFIYSILNALSLRTGSIGTAGIWDDAQKTSFRQTVPTTPEAPDIHRVLDHFNQKGMKAAVIESTSIAIEQKRLATIDFNVAVHTNLTPEHLEFHGSMENYKQAKLKLFEQAERAVVNIDDTVMAGDILEFFNGPLLTYGKNERADLRMRDIRTTLDGTSFTLQTHEGLFEVHAPVYGEYNVSNLLAAIGACKQSGYSMPEILSVISMVKCPEGRYQIVKNDAPYQIVLDYAHTPDALSNILQAVRSIPYHKLIVMITGVGLRDPNKRPLMAKTVEGMADEIIVSVDQPGFADRQEVVNDVLKGFRNPLEHNIHTKLYREEAIHHAFDLAASGDLVLLTGIGFGGYQVIGNEKVPYSELEVIDDYFNKCPSYKDCVMF